MIPQVDWIERWLGQWCADFKPGYERLQAANSIRQYMIESRCKTLNQALVLMSLFRFGVDQGIKILQSADANAKAGITEGE